MKKKQNVMLRNQTFQYDNDETSVNFIALIIINNIYRSCFVLV